MSEVTNQSDLLELGTVGRSPAGNVAKLRVYGIWGGSGSAEASVRWRESYKTIKRSVDVLVAVFALPMALVVCACAAVAIYVTMGRPVLFFQERVGLNGSVFRIIKLRTMRQDVEPNGVATTQCDPRITPLGGFLRRAHIDELPQLWNVLVGEMTLIGPRAEQVPLVEKYRSVIPNYDLRHSVVPGLSGWAQVCYGYAADTAETMRKTEYDLYYVNHFGPKLDLLIVAKTLLVFMDRRFVR